MNSTANFHLIYIGGYITYKNTCRQIFFLFFLHCHAAIHTEDLAGDIAGLVAGEEGNGLGDILDGAESLDGNDVLGGLLDGLREDVGHVRLNEPGGDAVGRDAFFADLAGDRLGQADESRLAGGVVGRSGLAHDAGDGADIDDAAEFVADHRSGRHARGREGRPQIHGDDLVKVVVVHLDHQLVAGDAGVVDQDVDATVLGGELFEHLSELGCVRDVDTAGQHVEARIFGGVLEVLELIGDNVQGRDDASLL